MNVAQAKETLNAGANLVQICAGLVYRGPRLVAEFAAATAVVNIATPPTELMAMGITQTVTIRASAKEIYDALISAEAFSEFTRAPAEISEHVGGEFSCFGGQVTGRHIELRPNERIVQAWRVSSWPEATYSTVKFDLDQSGAATSVTLEHTEFPQDAEEHLVSGWHKMYWEPLKAYLER
jgi:activator of HSP90 ATPase